MARTEELATELRTLKYDHERLSSMHRTASEKAANFEREMNVHKSRLGYVILPRLIPKLTLICSAVTRTLQTTESAHRHTTAELQRTRTSLQAIRTAHQSELKKKEKDIERMTEKWTRIAETQVKLMTAPSGLRCANIAVTEGSEVLGKGKGFLEVALEQAEKTGAQLSVENLELRKLVLTAVNESQAVLSEAKGILSGDRVEEVCHLKLFPHVVISNIAPQITPFTLSTLFPLAPSGLARDQLTTVLTTLRNSLSLLSPLTPTVTKPSATIVPDGEVERLQSLIALLKEELRKLIIIGQNLH